MYRIQSILTTFKKTEIQFHQFQRTFVVAITTDTVALPDNSNWYVMSKDPDITLREVGNLYGLRTWVEYGLKQNKNELGWADYV